MFKLITYLVIFIVVNFLLISQMLEFQKLKKLSEEQAMELSDKTRNSIRAGIVNVIPINQVKDYTKLSVMGVVLGIFVILMAVYKEEFISFVVFFCLLPCYLLNSYGRLFEILPNGLILNTRLVKWQEMKSFQLIQITSSHKYYGFDLEINNTTELLIKLNNKRNSTISYTITDINVRDDLVSFLEKNGVSKEIG
ncbi:MAG: hypothetical protein ACK4M9_22270 [Anaerobacillus sp.]|uniref:hypothetical protein n=1 Tax=Anaerobacillus sp. TaxID=1872506 RepID=UPI003919EB72